MASQIQQNINISAGVSFTKQFTALNEDRSAKDLTGYTVLARMAKHSGAVDALKSTNDAPIWRYIDFTTSLVNATSGVYSITIPASTTSKLKEGKYVYNVNVTDINGYTSPCVSGLVFVDRSFGSPHELGVQDSDDVHVDDVFY